MSLDSAGMKILVPRKGALSPKDSVNVLLNTKLWLLPVLPLYFGIIVPADKEMRCCVDHHENIRLVLYKRGREKYAWQTHYPLGISRSPPQSNFN